MPGLGRSHNVIGVLDTPASCLRIAMAHADSTPNGPGANDNASGVAVIAATAGRLRGLDPPCDVWLVATGAEERLHTGAPDHGPRSRSPAERAPAATTADSSGRCPSTRWGATARSGCARRPRRRARPWRARCYGSRPARRPLSWVRDEGTGNSDREFELLGLPGMRVGVGAGGERPCRHSPCRPRAARPGLTAGGAPPARRRAQLASRARPAEPAACG